MANTRPSGHLSGGKYTASHTTVIAAAEAPARAAARLGSVSKISLGLIKTLRNGPPAIKFTEECSGCLLVKVRGGSSIKRCASTRRTPKKREAAMTAAFTGR